MRITKLIILFRIRTNPRQKEFRLPRIFILETGKNTISTAVDTAITTVVSKLPTREFIDDAAHVSLSNSAANVRISAYKTNLGNQALKGVAKAGVTTVALYVVDMGLMFITMVGGQMTAIKLGQLLVFLPQYV